MWLWKGRFAVVDVLEYVGFVYVLRGERHTESDISNHINEAKHHINHIIEIILINTALVFFCVSMFILSLLVFI